MRQHFIPATILVLPLLLGGPSVFAQQPGSVAKPASVTDPFFLTRAKNLARQAAEQQNGGLKVYRAEAVMYGPAVNVPHTQNSDGSITFTFKGGPPGSVTPTVETVAIVTSGGIVQLQYNGPLRSATTATVKADSPSQRPATTQNEPAVLEKPVPIPVAPATSVASPQPLTPLPQSTATSVPNGPRLPPLDPAANTSSTAPSQGRPPATPLPTQQVPPPGASPIPANNPPQASPITPNNKDISTDLFLPKARNLARQAAIKANGGLAQYRPEPSMFGPTDGTPHTKNPDGSITFKFQGGVPGYTTPTLESVITVNQKSDVTVTYNGPIRP